MTFTLKSVLACLLLSMPGLMSGCGCGFDCNSDDEDNPAVLSLGMSDSLPEDLKEVVIEVDSITLRRSSGSEAKIDSFTIEDLDLVDAASFKIDLLDYQGVDQLVVISKLEIPTGNYDEVVLEILVGSIERSYVKLQNDSLREITVANGILTLPGMRLSSGTQRYVIEFGLAQALQYQSATDTYPLTSTGVRIENTATAATISGQVDTELFDTAAPCREKSDPEGGNRVYLYRGIDLVADNLADVFTSASSPAAPANAIAPFAVASLVEDTFTGNWRYSVGYVPAGDYTLAFACDTADDDSVNFNDLLIPLPANELREVRLAEGEKAVCDLELNGSC